MNAKWSLNHGNEFPFDAPDAWWNGDKTKKPPLKDWAHSAARGVIADLQGRRGIKNELQIDRIDDDTRQELVESLAEIIREAANRKAKGTFTI